MKPPTPGQLWLIRPNGEHPTVAAIRSREQDSWTVLSADGNLTVITAATLVRPIPGECVPAGASWQDRVRLLAGFTPHLTGSLG